MERGERGISGTGYCQSRLFQLLFHAPEVRTEFKSLEERDERRQIPAPGEMKIIPGAGHLFEEKGALEKVALLASEWFDLHLR